MDVYEAIDLNSNEAKVYEVLLLLKNSSVTNISTTCGLERTMIYGILSRLVEKGLVTTFTKEGIKQFSPVPPQEFLNIIQEKKEAIERQLPDLNKIYSQNPIEQGARIYSGKKAVKNLLDELLNEKQTWHVIGGTLDIKKVLDVYLPQFHRKRKENKIQFHVLFTQESSKRAIELEKEKYTKIRFLSKDFSAPMHVAITGNKVAFNLWTPNPLGILIESKDVANSFRKYFAFLWKLAK